MSRRRLGIADPFRRFRVSRACRHGRRRLPGTRGSRARAGRRSIADGSGDAVSSASSSSIGETNQSRGVSSLCSGIPRPPSIAADHPLRDHLLAQRRHLVVRGGRRDRRCRRGAATRGGTARQASPRARSASSLTQLDTADLAAARLRQLVDELDLARVLVRRRDALHVLLELARELVGEPSRPGRSTTNALTICPRSASGLPTTALSATAACSSSALSTSNGPDPVGGRQDHVVGAAGEPEVAVLVADGPVAGHVPVAAEDRARLVRLLPVAGEERRRTVHAARCRPPRRAGAPPRPSSITAISCPGDGSAHRARADLHAGEVPDEQRVLGLPVAVVDRRSRTCRGRRGSPRGSAAHRQRRHAGSGRGRDRSEAVRLRHRADTRSGAWQSTVTPSRSSRSNRSSVSKPPSWRTIAAPQLHGPSSTFQIDFAQPVPAVHQTRSSGLDVEPLLRLEALREAVAVRVRDSLRVLRRARRVEDERGIVRSGVLRRRHVSSRRAARPPRRGRGRRAGSPSELAHDLDLGSAPRSVTRRLAPE